MFKVLLTRSPVTTDRSDSAQGDSYQIVFK
jgi:hypothetical protein